MLPRFFAALAALALLAVVTVRVPAASADAVVTDATALDELSAMNAAREAVGLPSLLLAPIIQEVALARAAALAASGVLSHDDPAGEDAATLLAQAGVWFDRLGENLGATDAVAWDVVGTLHAAWMASPPHSANILNPGFSQVGIGFASDGTTVYAVVVFLD